MFYIARWIINIVVLQDHEVVFCLLRQHVGGNGFIALYILGELINFINSFYIQWQIKRGIYLGLNLMGHEF